MILDWTDSTVQVSTHFTVKEALWLPQWHRLANEQDGLSPDLYAAIFGFCATLDKIRDFLGCSMNIHCLYRPGPYSVLVGGHATDVHTMGIAVDFDCSSMMSCDQVKSKLLPKKDDGTFDYSIMEGFGIRMEDNGAGAGWVHLDTHPVIHARFFKA